MKWEYHIIYDQPYILYEDLNEMGLLGWELVSIINYRVSTEIVSEKAVFKRPKDD